MRPFIVMECSLGDGLHPRSGGARHAITEMAVWMIFDTVACVCDSVGPDSLAEVLSDPNRVGVEGDVRGHIPEGYRWYSQDPSYR